MYVSPICFDCKSVITNGSSGPLSLMSVYWSCNYLRLEFPSEGEHLFLFHSANDNDVKSSSCLSEQNTFDDPVILDTEDNAGAVDPMHPLIVFMAGTSIIGGLAGLVCYAGTVTSRQTKLNGHGWKSNHLSM